MNANTFFNGLRFSEYVFSGKINSYLFVDFDMIFIDEGFWRIAKGLLEEACIAKIVVENIDPDIHFKEEIQTADLPSKFLEIVNSETVEGYFDVPTSFHMITVLSIIYSTGDNDNLCILMDRDYSIAIVGFSNPRWRDHFYEYEIKDLPDYLRLTFAGKELPGNLKDSLRSNWGY
jgi:hypothetical protein